MKMLKTLAVLAAACLCVAARAADPLPAGLAITGQVSGATTTLLGLDHGFDDVPGSNITALAADDLEFLTGDYAVAVDFFTDGRIQVWNNSGAALLPGAYAFTFDLGAGPAVTGFAPLALTGVSLQVLGEHRVAIAFSDLDFGSEYGSFTAQLQVAAVPEPASAVLLGLGLLALARTRRTAA